MSVFLPDEDATLAAGARLAAALAALAESEMPDNGLHLHLHGPLGSGKTTLVRGLLRALGISAAVRSPTYTLVESYQAAGLDLFHFDLYRMGDAEELELMGARDHFRAGAVCLFEWPERGSGWLPAPDLVLRLAHALPGRSLEACAPAPSGESLAVAALGP